MRIKTELLDFVEQESKKVGKDERLLGTSEIIESVFGKMKRLEHDQAKSGFTVFILSLAAIVLKPRQRLSTRHSKQSPQKKSTNGSKRTWVNRSKQKGSRSIV